MVATLLYLQSIFSELLSLSALSLFLVLGILVLHLFVSLRTKQ
jgi:hypothetical protein